MKIQNANHSACQAKGGTAGIGEGRGGGGGRGETAVATAFLSHPHARSSAFCFETHLTLLNTL